MTSRSLPLRSGRRTGRAISAVCAALVLLTACVNGEQPAETVTAPSVAAPTVTAPTMAPSTDAVTPNAGTPNAVTPDAVTPNAVATEEPPATATSTPAAAPAASREPVNLGPRESSRGAGSFVTIAQQHFFPVEALSGTWVADAALVSDIAECESPTELALVAGLLLQADDLGREAGYFNNVTLLVEIHSDAAAATARVASAMGDQRSACQIAAFDQRERDPSGLYATESDNPGGVVIDPHLDRPGLQTASFDLALTGPGISLPLTRTLTMWSAGQTVFTMEIITRDGTNAEIAAEVSDAIEAQASPTAAFPDPVLDVSLDTVRRATLTDDVLADFFNFQAPLQVLQPDSSNGCSQDYPEPALLEIQGPVWSLRTGTSALIQGATIFADADAAAAEMQRAELTAAECLGSIGPTMIPGSNETLATDSEVVTVDGISMLKFSADILQTMDQPGTILSADARIEWTLAQMDNVILQWGFVGVAGDEPDLNALMVRSIAQAEDPS